MLDNANKNNQRKKEEKDIIQLGYGGRWYFDRRKTLILAGSAQRF